MLPSPPSLPLIKSTARHVFSTHFLERETTAVLLITSVRFKTTVIGPSRLQSELSATLNVEGEKIVYISEGHSIEVEKAPAALIAETETEKSASSSGPDSALLISEAHHSVNEQMEVEDAVEKCVYGMRDKLADSPQELALEDVIEIPGYAAQAYVYEIKDKLTDAVEDRCARCRPYRRKTPNVPHNATASVNRTTPIKRVEVSVSREV